MLKLYFKIQFNVSSQFQFSSASGHKAYIWERLSLFPSSHFLLAKSVSVILDPSGLKTDRVLESKGQYMLDSYNLNDGYVFWCWYPLHGKYISCAFQFWMNGKFLDIIAQCFLWLTTFCYPFIPQTSRNLSLFKTEKSFRSPLGWS